jgi:hypothetical protein
MLALAAALAVVPAAAGAKTADPLAGARLDSATYTLAIKTSRCPGPSDPAAKTCAHLNVKNTFDAGPKAKLTRTEGQPKFPAGLRVAGAGRSTCTSESPLQGPVQGPDGTYDVGSAIRTTSKPVNYTEIAISSDRRGTRWAWLEPSSPAVPCHYFQEDATVSFPELVTTDRFPATTLKKRRFDVTLEMTPSKFVRTEPDGTVVYGEASWKLVLGYKR